MLCHLDSIYSPYTVRVVSRIIHVHVCVPVTDGKQALVRPSLRVSAISQNVRREWSSMLMQSHRVKII